VLLLVLDSIIRPPSSQCFGTDMVC